MVIYHAMVVHTQPDRLYDALTQAPMILPYGWGHRRWPDQPWVSG